MSVEGFDAALPIEAWSAVFRAGMAETAAAGAELTLDAALAAVPRAADSRAAASPDREAMREATALDLWINDRTGTGFTPLPSAGGFAPLKIAEIHPVATQPELGPPVVVVGHRYIYNPAIVGYDMDGDDWRYGSEQQVPPPEGPAPQHAEIAVTLR